MGRTIASQVRACGEIRARLSNDHWRTILAARNDFRDALHALSLAPSPGGPAADGEGEGGGAARGERYESYDRVALMSALETLAMQLSAISGA